MIASSSTDRTVDLGSLGPVGRSVAEIRFFHLATVFGLIPWRRARTLRALLTMLYRSTDCLSRAGASVEYLAHSASFHPAEKIAPSNSGTKHLGREAPPFRGYREKRNITSHTYNEERAEEVVAGLDRFVDDIRFILTQLKRRNPWRTSRSAHRTWPR